MSNSTPTVRFNVGGLQSEVSRDIIASQEGTMLHRLVSDTWQQSEQNDPIFIDRDGEHFRLLLHYLRYGRVSVPLAVSADNFLLDLDFYGIIPKEGSIDTSSSSPKAAGMMVHCERVHSKKVGVFDEKIQELERQKRYVILAHECFLRHSKDGSMQFTFQPKYDEKHSVEHKIYEVAFEALCFLNATF